MNRSIAAFLCCAFIISSVPSLALAQAAVRKTPRKYDKLLTAVESFAKLNAQIEIREREYDILAPYVQEVIFYSDGLLRVCDMKCYKSVNNYHPRLQKYVDALREAHRRYQAMAPNITSRNNDLMSEIKRVNFVSDQKGKEKVIASLNQLDLESLFHYKQYASTYHSADTAMLSLAASSDVARIVNSFASTTERLVKAGRTPPSITPSIGNLQSKIPDVRARIKALEDRRKSLVCEATLAQDYSVSVRCTPSY